MVLIDCVVKLDSKSECFCQKAKDGCFINGLIRVVALFLLVFIAVSVNAENYKYSNWHVYIEEDEFGGSPSVEAFSFGKNVYNSSQAIGIRCFDEGIRITFEMVKYVAIGGRRVLGRYRIDKNDAQRFDGRLFTNSRSSGYQIDLIQGMGLLEELKSGTRIMLEISNKRRSNIYKGSFSLLGFTKAYKKVKNHCK